MAREGIRCAYKQRGLRIPTRDIKCNREDRQNLLQSELCSHNRLEWMKANETIMLIYILGKFSAISQISGTDGALSGGASTFCPGNCQAHLHQLLNKGSTHALVLYQNVSCYLTRFRTPRIRFSFN